MASADRYLINKWR